MNLSSDCSHRTSVNVSKLLLTDTPLICRTASKEIVFILFNSLESSCSMINTFTINFFIRIFQVKKFFLHILKALKATSRQRFIHRSNFRSGLQLKKFQLSLSSNSLQFQEPKTYNKERTLERLEKAKVDLTERANDVITLVTGP